MLYKVHLLIPLFILKTHAGCSRCQCCARDGVQWYLSRKQSRHPRTATRVQLAASAAGRGDFSALFPAGRLWGPDTDPPTHRRTGGRRRGCCCRRRGEVSSGGLMSSGGELRTFFFFFFSFFVFFFAASPPAGWNNFRTDCRSDKRHPVRRHEEDTRWNFRSEYGPPE